MDEQIAKSQNKMGVMPINKLIISMSLPMMASMLVQALYNIVDSIFVAQISENALNAVTLAFPVQNIMISIGVGTGVGINALIAKYLGQREYKKANEVATNGVFLAALSYVVMLVFGIFFSAIYYRVQTDNAEIIAHGISYLSIVSCCSFGIFGQLVFEKLLQATGKTFYSMVVQAIGAVINIILDPILIFGWFGLPKMGVAGAAIATVIGQITSFVVAVFINHYKNSEIRVKIKGFKPSGKTIRNIYSVGVPSIIM
ncbi:MAG: MATE family efflux transporter, partial [Oscillospiraceae bacterium]